VSLTSLIFYENIIQEIYKTNILNLDFQKTKSFLINQQCLTKN